MKTIEDIFTDEKELTIVRKIRTAVKELLPDSTVILFGSWARGDAVADSDWDLLVLTEKVNPAIEQKVFSAVYDIELEKNIIICPLLISRDEWDSKRYRHHPIHESVEAEGVLVA